MKDFPHDYLIKSKTPPINYTCQPKLLKMSFAHYILNCITFYAYKLLLLFLSLTVKVKGVRALRISKQILAALCIIKKFLSPLQRPPMWLRQGMNDYKEIMNKRHMCPRHDASSGYRWKRQPSDMAIAAKC